MLASTPVSCTCGEREGGAGEGDVGASARLGWHAVVAQATCPRAQPSTPRRRWLWSRTAGVAVGSEHAATLREEELRASLWLRWERGGEVHVRAGRPPPNDVVCVLLAGREGGGRGLTVQGPPRPIAPLPSPSPPLCVRSCRSGQLVFRLVFARVVSKKRVFDILMFRCPGAAPPAQRDRPAWSGNGVSVG